jgi:NADPH-dependent 2,4-dienoyl-CoA reductase/sulfur reductase-like enzyme
LAGRPGPHLLDRAATQANAMGAAAARAILGLADAPVPLPWFWSTQGKTLIQMAGLPEGVTETVTRGDPASGWRISSYVA